MGKRNSPSAIVSGAGWIASFAVILEKALLRRNWTLEDIHAMVTETDAEEQPIDKIAAMLVGGSTEASVEIEQIPPQPAIEYFTSLTDEQAITALVEAKKYSAMEATSLVVSWRTLARRWGCSSNIWWRVRAGFTLKSHAAQLGPCVENFQYLQGWNFSDEPTQDCMVFWVPRLVPNSTSKTRDEQVAFLGKIRQENKLPAHHLESFGSVTLLAGLILANHKATGEKVPLGSLIARTETCRAGGYRLSLYWIDGRLHCAYWSWDVGRYASVGVFALGVEVLGS